MPLVEIFLWKDCADDLVKERLIGEVSRKVSEIIGAPIQAVEVLIHEVPKTNWGIAGIPATKNKYK